MFPYKDCLPYLQKHIPSALENEKNVEKLYSFDEAFCKKYDVSVLMETVISRINFKKKRISTENKNHYDYDVMVIADVPDNYLPDVKGTNKTGVYSVQKLFDVVNIKHATIFCDTVVISTDRLFGLDMAKSLLAAKKDTLCILPKNFILKRLLSDAAYAKVIAWLQSKGLQVFADTSVTEIMGGGMPKKSVLKKMGLEGYNGWAFGFGLERLAIISMELPDIRLLWSDDERVKKQLVLGNKFTAVSKYPAVVRDISFIVNSDFAPNNYFDLVRDVVGEMAEEMALIDKYENALKFGADKVSYAYRITYRSLDRTLTSEEVDALHKELERRTTEVFGATVR
jgi:hypothetical protein